MDHQAFVTAPGWVFERSPWGAKGLGGSVHSIRLAALHEAMVREVAEASPEEQLLLIRALPGMRRATAIAHASPAMGAAGRPALRFRSQHDAVLARISHQVSSRGA